MFVDYEWRKEWPPGKPTSHYFFIAPRSFLIFQIHKDMCVYYQTILEGYSYSFRRFYEDIAYWEKRIQMRKIIFHPRIILGPIFFKWPIGLFFRKQKPLLMPINNQRDKLSRRYVFSPESTLWNWTDNHTKALWSTKHGSVFLCFISVNYVSAVQRAIKSHVIYGPAFAMWRGRTVCWCRTKSF